MGAGRNDCRRSACVSSMHSARRDMGTHTSVVHTASGVTRSLMMLDCVRPITRQQAQRQQRSRSTRSEQPLVFCVSYLGCLVEVRCWPKELPAFRTSQQHDRSNEQVRHSGLAVRTGHVIQLSPYEPPRCGHSRRHLELFADHRLEHVRMLNNKRNELNADTASSLLYLRGHSK